MKKTILLLAIAMASLMAHAQSIAILEAYQLGNYNIVYPQNNHICQPDTILLHTNHSIIEGDSVLLFNAYDNCGLFTQCEEYYTDDDMKEKQNWKLPPLRNKTEYEYDLNHNIVKMTEKGFYVPRPGSFISTYTYENGKLALYVRQYSDSFITYVRDSILYQYDALGRIQDEICYGLSGDLLNLCKHTSYDYISNGIETTVEGLTNGTWGDWVQLNKETKTFDDDGLLLNVVSESYDNPAKSEYYTYDTECRIKSILTKTWDGTEWVNTKLLEYSYDANGHLILAEIKSWQDDMFINFHRAIYERNEAGYPSVVVFEKWDDEEWVQGTWQPGFFIFSEDYLERQNTFICRKDVKRIELHYISTPMPDYKVYEHQLNQASATVHPNPTNGQITIIGKDLKQAEVLNTLGQRVATATGKGETMQIDIDNLPAGVYFINITDEEGRKCVKKVVKE